MALAENSQIDNVILGGPPFQPCTTYSRAAPALGAQGKKD